MRRMLLGLAVFLALASPAQAENLVRFRDVGTVLSVACNGSLTTSAAYVEGSNAATFSWDLTDANSSVTAVTATCVGTGAGDEDATTTYKLPVITATAAGGTVTYVPFTYSYAPTISSSHDKSQFTIGVNGNRYAKCTFACGGAAADSIVVKVTVTAQ